MEGKSIGKEYFETISIKYIFSAFMYLKFICIWGIIMAADYLLEFRFEFLWPFWLVLRSICDSFKYQGLVRCSSLLYLFELNFYCLFSAFFDILCNYCIRYRSHLLYLITCAMVILRCQ